MQERCPRCIERLRLRLGTSAGDLGRAVIALPLRLLHGDHGSLGPLRWQRLERSDTTQVTLWSLPRAQLRTAHGLLWADGAPDLRDADSAKLEQAWRRLAAQVDGADVAGRVGRWIPEQGPVQSASAPQAHLHYLAALRRAIDEAQARGAAESDPAPALAGVPEVFNRSARHQLNWQHAWREAEARWMAEDTGPSADKATAP
jgi:hypothetical protein